ncbi:MAG TPA: hypothetical protein EYO59_12980 [Chromatiaceae bacterium]|jgi:hypothetical protein|nr:hypothetical protein [Chromatiaceae bacterium]
MLKYIVVMITAISVLGCAGCKTSYRFIGNIPQCTEWSEEAIDQLSDLLQKQEAGKIDIHALEIEIGRLVQTCQSLEKWQEQD